MTYPHFHRDRTRKDGYRKWCKVCVHNYQFSSAAHTFINHAKFGWTKWGGANHGLMKSDVNTDWTCQSCARLVPKELPGFMYEYSEREYIRICASCCHIVIFQEIKSFFDLISLVRN